jgi:heme-degrading monooxygenase HmoA
VNEFKVKDILSSVETRIRSTSGLERIETLADNNDPNRFVVLTQWTSRKHLNTWLESDLCKQVVKELDTVLAKKPTYREFIRHDDDVFLL